MIRIRKGKVVAIQHSFEDMVEVLLETEEGMHKGIHYPKFMGDIKVGDRVYLNTTAVELGLGTGGYHFVIGKEEPDLQSTCEKGHIMKLRYTPLQIQCHTAEEKYPEIFNGFQSLEGMPILIGSIHSMLIPAAMMIKKERPSCKLAYIMSDGASLPIAFSKSVHMLKNKGYIDTTITIGHAFGGDYEAVNLYTGLITAKEIAKCDSAIILMGPGHVGTGTTLGFTGMEIVQHVQITEALGGVPITIPRVSFGDFRKRHYGISHHFQTAMGKYCPTRVHMSLPVLEKAKDQLLKKQCTEAGLMEKHSISFIQEDTISLLEKEKIQVTTMGRAFGDDPEFFQTAGACGKLLTQFL